MAQATLFEVDPPKPVKPIANLVMMHVSNAGEMPDGTQAVRFECQFCEHETDWIKERKPYGIADQKGRPCPNCNLVGPMKMTANISPCQKYRWDLTRVWGDGGRMACWIMLNPSKADFRVNDPTILRVIHFSRSWGYDGFKVVNMFPYRSADPTECRDHFAGSWEGPDWDIRDILMHNQTIVVEAAQSAAIVIAAWGNIGWPDGHSWGEHILESVQEFEQPTSVYCLGLTMHGNPKHPLARGVHRVPNDQQPVLWKSI